MIYLFGIIAIVYTILASDRGLKVLLYYIVILGLIIGCIWICDAPKYNECHDKSATEREADALANEGLIIPID